MHGGDNAEVNLPVTAPKSPPANASFKGDESKTKKLTAGTRSISSKATSGTTSPAKSANANSRSSLAKTSSPATKTHVSSRKTARASLHVKSPEELLNEIIDLKKALSLAKDENTTLKAKLRRSEDENNRKEKLIYQLSMGVTKTESQKHSTNSAVNNLKRRIEKLEMTLKDKETQIKKMQSDARATKQESVKRASESPSENLARRSQGSTSTRDSGRRSQVLHGSPTARGRGSSGPSSNRSQTAVTSEDVEQLKTWLRRALRINEDIQKKYESMSNLELIAKINRLEEEIETNKTVYEEIEKLRESDGTSSSEVVLRGDIEKLKEEVKYLQVDRSAFYETIEKKDAELARLKDELETMRKENAKMKPKHAGSPSGIKRSPHGLVAAKTPPQRATASSSAIPLSSSQTHSSAREVSPKQAITASKAHQNGTPVTTTTVTTKSATRKSQTLVTTSKVLQSKPVPEVPTDQSAAETGKDDFEGQSISSDLSSPEVEHFRQNLAAKKIQKSWKKHHGEEVEPVNGNVKEAKLQAIKENHAARVIQKGWKASKQTMEQEIDEAVVIIQSVARGHSERSQCLGSLNDVPDDGVDQMNSNEPSAWKDDLDASATIIQAAARGHYAREEMLRKWEGSNGTGTILQDEPSMS